MQRPTHQTAHHRELEQDRARQSEQDQRISQLQEQNAHQIATARTAEDAAEEFSRAASGFNGHILPAPALYDVLAALKLTLHSLESVAQFLPRGLANSLDEPSITVIEGTLLGSDVPRDPAQQAALAISHLGIMHNAISEAAQHAERAQAAISSQGYIPSEQAPSATRPHQNKAIATNNHRGSQGSASTPKQERNASMNTMKSRPNSSPPTPPSAF